MRQRYKNTFAVCALGVVSTFIGTFVYQLLTKAATRPAFRPALKASVVAVALSIGYFKYEKHAHDQEINKYFLQITN